MLRRQLSSHFLFADKTFCTDVTAFEDWIVNAGEPGVALQADMISGDILVTG